MSDNASSLFWILQEQDIENDELFLPANTPIGNVNPARLHSILKKRHENERKRLLNVQAQELAEYQKKFSTEKKDDLFITPNIVFIQSMSSADFLKENTSEIADIITIKPNQYNHHPRTASVDEGFIKENYEIKDRQKKFQDMLKNDYKDGFAVLNQRHVEQFKLLEKCQKEDLARLPSDILDKSEKELLPVNDDMEIDSAPTPYQKRRIQEDEPADPRKRKPTSRSTFKPSLLSIPKSNKKDSSPVSSPTVPSKSSPITRPKPLPTKDMAKPNIQRQKPRIDPSTSTSTSRNNEQPRTTKTNKQPISLSKSHNMKTSLLRKANNENKSIPISVPGRTATPIIAPSNTDNNSSSNLPLFANNSEIRDRSRRQPNAYQKVYSMIDKGPIIIRSKPNRVMIKGVNYGDPKDFDDAINGVQNPTNPITKRYMQGDYYLFHNSEENGVVNLGPVSKIQPLIQKFFLSM